MIDTQFARPFAVAAFAAALLGSGGIVHAQTAPAHPDLQGFWTSGTLTPLQRPPEFKDREIMSEAEAADYERTALDRLLASLPEVDRFGADLNYIYLDRHAVGSDRRTALIVDPRDGRIPAQLQAAKDRAAARPKSSFDGPETQGLDERCLLETAVGSSNASPPMVPNPFGQNLYQIVQTPTHVLIFTEVVHDARIIRIGGQHLPTSARLWLGDSIARWEGDTLVVDTTNFSEKTHFRGSGPRLHVVERFTRVDASTIRYRFTVEDPDTWATPWSAEIPFRATTDRIFEYACHEGNYSLENGLRGARAEEKTQGK